MPPDTSISLINLGDLSKLGETLIKKVSNAVGGFSAPWQIKRVAKAEAEAEFIKALTKAQSEIEIDDLHQRAMHRFVEEEAQRQKNMEDITVKALPKLNEDAKPDSIEDDWLVNFFDKCRIVSDDEMQGLWSRVLSGEANGPGTYSKRTVNFLSDLDKAEAKLFTKLCGFTWDIGGIYPLIFDHKAEIYNRNDINYSTLSHLDSIGFTQFNGPTVFFRVGLPKKFSIHYYGKPLDLEMPQDVDNELEVGNTLLTSIGQELASICGSKPVEGFYDYVKDNWKQYLSESERKQ